VRVIHTRKQEKNSSKKDTKEEKNLTEVERKVNMLDIQGYTNRELVIVCSCTLINYITDEEGVGK
jgi:hypothetical protein